MSHLELTDNQVDALCRVYDFLLGLSDKKTTTDDKPGSGDPAEAEGVFIPLDLLLQNMKGTDK